MQQTETYKLNLIELSDKFSPDPLNENAQKLEAALFAETETRSGQTAGLEQRVAVLESRKIAVGSFTGTGKDLTISLPFTPLAVIAQRNSSFGAGISVKGFPYSGLHVVDNGFTISASLNSDGRSFIYCAIS